MCGGEEYPLANGDRLRRGDKWIRLGREQSGHCCGLRGSLEWCGVAQG